MTSGNTIHVDFLSSLEMLDLVQLVSDHIGRRAGLDDEALHWVGVAVRESVINAIKHGNCSDVRKRVHVEFTVLQDSAIPGLAICVRDEGCGFDPEGRHGLGLLTMRERAQQAGGTLEITSEPGRGSCVRARFPLPG